MLIEEFYTRVKPSHNKISPGSSARQFVEIWFSTQYVSIVSDIELGSVDLLVELAAQGYGVAFITRKFVEKEIADGKLLELKPAIPIPDRTIGLITRKDRGLSLAAAQFVEMFTNQVVNQSNSSS